jgi:hypothetical protein
MRQEAELLPETRHARNRKVALSLVLLVAGLVAFCFLYVLLEP